MKLIKSYFDYLIVLIEKNSTDVKMQNEAKNALRILHQFPEKYKEYCDNSKSGKSLIELGMSENEIQLLAFKMLSSLQVSQELFSSYPVVLNHKLAIPAYVNRLDVLAAVKELPIEKLLTKAGKPINEETLLKRCLTKVLEQGKINEVVLRREIVKLFSECYEKGEIPLKNPYGKEEVIRYFQNEAPLASLIETFAFKNNKPITADKRRGLLIVALAAIDAIDENMIVDAALNNYKPLLNQLPREVRGHAKKTFCSACREVISTKGVKSFICADGTINVYKVLMSIPEKGNEELFEMLLKRQENNNDRP